MSTKRFTIGLLAWGLALAGCARHRIKLPPHHLPDGPLTKPRKGFSVQGRPLEHVVYGSGRETILMLGGIHGNEPAGTVLLNQLCEYLSRRPGEVGGRQVVVVPAANPDGLASKQRTNGRGVDVNRNFATRNWKRSKACGPRSMSEPETRFIADTIDRYRPVRIVTVHQPLKCVDWDGPARELAEVMSRASGLPVKKLGAKSGSLGSYAGVERHIPTITLELPAPASRLSGEAIWKRYGQALLEAIRYAPAAK